MSILIHSEDFKSGSSSDGVWDLSRNLTGIWEVVLQTMDAQTFPWMWTGRDTMVFRIHDPMDDSIHDTFGVTFNSSLGLISNLDSVGSTITAAIQQRIDEVALTQPYVARTVSVTYNGTSQELVFVFIGGNVDVLWGFDDPEDPELRSTINPSFSYNTATADQFNVSTFSVSTNKIVTDPPYLFVYIDESSSEILTTSLSLPNIIFSTVDSQYTGQIISIREVTSSLTIKICLLHETEAIPLRGSWYLIFKKIG